MVAATDVGFARMQVSKVAGLNDGDRVREFVVLSELDGDRHPVIQIGRAEAVLMRRALTARPMTITKAES
jgi:hypothetical protein